MTNIKTALQTTIRRLSSSSSTSQVDAEVLLAHVLDTTRTYLYTFPEKLIPPETALSYEVLVQQRRDGVPIAYLTGKREFWSLDLKISDATLIPRPETELLVSVALENQHPQLTVLELGTGSGAISLALASERPNWHITAVDKSLAALCIAQENASRLKLKNIEFIHSDWYESVLDLQYDLILSNPPYIASDDPHLQQGDLRYEPHDALVSADCGLQALTHIIQNGRAHLKHEGKLLLEHGYTQMQAVMDLLNDAGYQAVRSWSDLSGHPRVSGGVQKTYK